MHGSLAGRASAFPAIAGDTAGDDVLPVFSAALGDRHDMIEGQLAGRKFLTAVLALVPVARVDVRARKGNVIESSLDPDVTQQSNDRGKLEAERNSSDLSVVHRDDLNLALAPERDGLLPMDNLEGFVRRVEEQRLFHGNLILGWIVPDSTPKCQAKGAVNRIVKRRLAALWPIGHRSDILWVPMAPCRADLQVRPAGRPDQPPPKLRRSTVALAKVEGLHYTPARSVACVTLSASPLTAACASS